jgi:hypothetical protein
VERGRRRILLHLEPANVVVERGRRRILLLLPQRCFSPRCFRRISCAARCSAFWTELPLLVSWRWRSFHKSFACIDAFAKITVRTLLVKYVLVLCLLHVAPKSNVLVAPISNVQTAKCPRLARFAAGSVTTFPSGIISATATFVKRQSAMIAPSSVYNAARNSAPSAKILTIAKSARYHFVFIVKKRLTVLNARRDSVYTAKSPTTAKCAKRHSVMNAKTVTTVKRATRRPVVSAKMWSSVTI